MDLLRNYQHDIAEKSTASAYSPDIKQQLAKQLQDLKFRQEKVEKLIALLEKNPDFVEMINLSREL